MFLAVTAEEKGLLGSRILRRPIRSIRSAKTVGVLNMDALGVCGPGEELHASRARAKLDLLDDLIAAGKQQGRYFTPDPHPETGGFFRSDHFSFAKRGVPAISFGSGNDLVNGGIARGEALATDYTANRYHQPADEFDPELGLPRHGAGRRPAAHRRRAARQFARVAELERRQRIPRGPRSIGGRAQRRGSRRRCSCNAKPPKKGERG